MEQITIISLISSAGIVSGVIFGFLGYSKGVKNDTYTDGAEKGTLKADITYIKRRTDDLLLEQKDTNKSLNVLAERVAKVEEIAKSAHKRIDQIEEKELRT